MTPRASTRRDRASDGALHKALLALLVVVPSLVTAAATYLSTAAEAKKAEAKLLANYGAYVEDQLRRDEALVNRLAPCIPPPPVPVMETQLFAPEIALSVEPPQADAVLNELARQEGWRPTP